MRKVLAVDDEVNILKLIKKRLEQSGFEVETAATGPEAINIYKQQPLLCVLLDLTLKTVDGLDVLKEMRQIDNEIPVIIVTGQYDELKGKRAVQLGAYEYMTKPIDFEHLEMLLNNQKTDEERGEL